MAYDKLKDNYEEFPKSLITPGRKAVAVVTSDTVDLLVYAKRLYIGVAGDVAVLAVGDSVAIVYKSHPVGYFDAVQVRRVNATGTTATNIVAIYE